jgi:glycine betaine/proline transport system permease protein
VKSKKKKARKKLVATPADPATPGKTAQT